MSLPDNFTTGSQYTAPDADAVADATNANTARFAGTMNPKVDHGALGDGSTDDGAAFLATYTAAVAGSVGAFSTEQRSVTEITVPPGTYVIKANAQLIANLAISPTRGIRFKGSGVESTMIVFEPSAANGYLCDNENDLLYLTFEDMSFYCTGANAATATFMKSNSTGEAQNYVFRRCNWGGVWQYGIDLTGTNNNGEMVWDACDVYGTWASFLHAGSSSTSDQFVNYNFFACNIVQTAGDFVDMAKGGNINVWGGSLIHVGNGNETTSSQQILFALRGASHSAGTPRLNVDGVRVEHRHDQSQLVYCEWATGLVKFTSCDTGAFQPVLTTPTNVVQAEFGANAQSYPEIVFDNCTLMGKHNYHFETGTYNFVHRIEYRSSEIESFLQAKDFINYVNDSSTDTGRAPAVKFTGCRSGLSTDYKETFDTTVGWQNSVNVVVSPKVLSIRLPWSGTSGLPSSGLSTWNANLPLNAIITRVRCFKGAGGSTSATNVTYTLTDADATVIATAVTGGSAWNASWVYDSGLLRYPCSTDNKRKLTLTSANITETTQDSFFLVDYLA